MSAESKARSPGEDTPVQAGWRRRDLLTLGGGVGVAGVLTAAVTATGRSTDSGAAACGQVLHGPVHVGDHGARGDGVTDDTAALQSVVDEHAGRVIVFGSGTYLVSQLLLPTGTYLDLGSAVLRRTGNTEGAAGGTTLRNADLDGGNADITVLGGTIEGGADATGRLLGFVNTQRVDVRGTTLRKGGSAFVDWMFVLQACEDVHVSDVRITGGTEVGEDGLHIKACSRVTVANCTIESGDDALAIVQQYRQQKPVRDIAVTNCVLSSRSAHMIRISVFPEEAEPIEGVVLSNILGRTPPGGSVGTPVLVNDDTGQGLIRRLSIDNVVIDARDSAGDAWRLANVRGIGLRGVRVVGADTRSFRFEACTDVSLSDCHAEAPRPGSGNAAWTFAACRDVSLVNCSATQAPVHGFEVNGASSAFRFISCHSTDSGAYGFHLEEVVGVLLSACVATGGVQGVNCDVASPPSGVRVLGCRFTGQTDRAVKTPPASTTVLAITEESVPPSGDRLAGPIGFFGAQPVPRPSVVGSRGGNEALAALIRALADLGLVEDDTVG
ncbi:Pectate lyase superfamily protein [Geodermatophilus amargosae]|uniref:Pectate lyase superfamily protein n=1 Tax=Geodermatophilus amargosae TaxID=1296565 RepID=A0A1I6X6T5_9ACTN|nr:glycosyl hydrolase family 28-related protein [Geodermatophilus amargosae]SFT33979.1 Pectate lyase superfamily protein [Geodermatophilus amargosae]